jgi:hypothetical protein
MAGDLKRFDSVSDGVRPKDHLVRNVGHIAEDEQTAGADSIDVGTGRGARDQRSIVTVKNDNGVRLQDRGHWKRVVRRQAHSDESLPV